MWDKFWMLYLALIGSVVFGPPLWLYFRKQISWIKEGLVLRPEMSEGPAEASLRRAKKRYSQLVLAGWLAFLIEVTLMIFSFLSHTAQDLLRTFWFVNLAVVIVYVLGFGASAIVKLKTAFELLPFRKVARGLNFGQLFFAAGITTLLLSRMSIIAQGTGDSWRGANDGAMAILLAIMLWIVALILAYIAFFKHLGISRRLRRDEAQAAR